MAEHLHKINEVRFGPWRIWFDPPPIPVRSCDWHYWHEDDDGDSASRSGSARSLQACLDEIWKIVQDEEGEAVPISAMKTHPDGDIHALLWCRLFVHGTDKTWWTDWKWMRGAWVRWTGTGINHAPCHPDSWYIPVADAHLCRVGRVEITHMRSLPPPPPG